MSIPLMTRSMPGTFATCGLAFALALLGAPALAQTVTTPPSLYQLSVGETMAAQEAARADPRVVSLIGRGPALAATSSVQIDKGEMAQFRATRGARTPLRYLNIVLFNETTNRAAEVNVQLGNVRVLSAEPLALNEVPIFREEAEAALALAFANPKVREAVGPLISSFRIALPGSDEPMPYAAEVLPVAASSERDPCFTGRCVEIIFRAKSGYLPLRVQVALATRTVTVIRRTMNSHGGMQH